GCGGYYRGLVNVSELLSFIERMQILYSFDLRQLVIATMIAIILAVLVVATLIRRQWRWREQDAFVVLSLAVFAFYALSRFAVSDIRDRLSLFVALTPLAWLELRLPRRAAGALAIAFAALAFGY